VDLRYRRGSRRTLGEVRRGREAAALGRRMMTTQPNAFQDSVAGHCSDSPCHIRWVEPAWPFQRLPLRPGHFHMHRKPAGARRRSTVVAAGRPVCRVRCCVSHRQRPAHWPASIRVEEAGTTRSPQLVRPRTAYRRGLGRDGAWGRRPGSDARRASSPAHTWRVVDTGLASGLISTLVIDPDTRTKSYAAAGSRVRDAG